MAEILATIEQGRQVAHFHTYCHPSEDARNLNVLYYREQNSVIISILVYPCIKNDGIKEKASYILLSFYIFHFQFIS